MKHMIHAAVAAALFAGATASNAATTITFDGQSGTFGNPDVTATSFNETITFTLAAAGSLSATISNIGSGAANIDFSSVLLNGSPFSLSPTGFAEFGSISSLPVSAGTQTIRIVGTSGGNGAYSGTLSFVPTAVPEPGVWAMMLAGFGMVGAYRRRSTRVAFA